MVLSLGYSSLEKKESGSILLAPQMRHISVLLDSVAWWDPERGIEQDASVGIRTKTSASSLDQLVCLGDLTHQLKLTP